MSNRLKLVAIVAVFGLSLGCPASYPKCENDGNCNTDGHHGVCVDGTCQECGKDSDCQAGFVCKSNTCQPKPECDNDSQCKSPQICRGQKCVIECQTDVDCGSGQTCKNNRCSVKAECVKDADCGGDRKCNAGTCEGPSQAAACTLDAVHFGYNEATLDDGAKSQLQKNADCMKTKPSQSVTIAGNCDDRGTEEYNLHLGQRRADVAKKYLIELGLTKSKLKTVSYGKDKPTCSEASESCWGQNRRDDFNP